MKVLIVNPPWETPHGYGCRSNTRWPHTRKDKYLIFPIYLGYAASILKEAGHEAVVLDAVAEEMNQDRLKEWAAKQQADLTFVETSTPSIRQDIESARTIKEANGGKVYLMGSHVTIFDEQALLDNTHVDGVVRGEFETTILDLANGILHKEVEGLTWRSESGTVVRNQDREPIQDLDSIPFPDYGQFDLKHYESHLCHSPMVWLSTTRGCPYNCSYCLWPQVMYGHKQRRRSPENVCDEIDYLIERYGIREIKFDDDTFALNKEHVIGICEEMIRRGHHKQLVWNCFGHISGYNEEMYRKMKEAGCERVFFGIESGSDRILKNIHKSLNLGKARGTIKLCKELGIGVYCTFMIGFPTETEEEIHESIRLALDLDPDYIQVSFVTPYPGTEMYSETQEAGTLKHGTRWDKYTAEGPAIINEGIPEDKLEKLYMTFWRSFYLRPKFLARQVRRVFTSYAEARRVFFGSISFYKRFLTG